MPGSSRCDEMGSAASWQCWDTGSNPRLARLVKNLALPQLQLRLQLLLGSDPWPRNSICHGVAGKKKKGYMSVFAHI